MELNESQPTITEHSEISENKPNISLSLLFRNFFLLWFKPNVFFNKVNSNVTAAGVIFCIYLMGVTSVADRIDSNIMKYYAGKNSNDFILSLANDWSYYWGFLLIVGIFAAALSWLFWGWIFNLRIKWSGDQDFDPITGRNIYSVTNLVLSFPHLCILLASLIIYPDYLTHYNHEELWSSSILVFLIWYFINQFLVVRKQFNVVSWKAALWFLVIPLLINGLILYVYISSLMP